MLIVLADESELAERARGIMEEAGAESIDSARESWWIGLRDAEEVHYARHGQDFKLNESNYRRGFEAALRPATRGKSYEDFINYLIAYYPGVYSEAAFRRGYERGEAHYHELMEKHKDSA